MKKPIPQFTFVTFLSLLLVLSCAISTVFADSSNVNVDVDWKHVTFNDDLGYPFIDNHDRTMIPFRAVANFMDGVHVLWSDDSKEAGFYVNKDVAECSDKGIFNNSIAC